MIVKTCGIVLHSIPYGETSLVVRIFTREYGLQSYLVQGVRKTRARIHQNLFQPLTIVDLVAYHKDRGGLQRIREIHCPAPFKSIPLDMLKTAIAIFLAEILTNTLKESDSSPLMFDYVKQAMEALDGATSRVSDFHLVFMLHLSRFLGFSPGNHYDQANCFFNLEEGLFQKANNGQRCLSPQLSQLFHNLAQSDFDTLDDLDIQPQQRKELLHRLIDYYRLHLDGLKEIRSHLVLETVLH